MKNAVLSVLNLYWPATAGGRSTFGPSPEACGTAKVRTAKDKHGMLVSAAIRCIQL